MSFEGGKKDIKLLRVISMMNKNEVTHGWMINDVECLLSIKLTKGTTELKPRSKVVE